MTMSYARRYLLYGTVFGLCFPFIASLMDAWLSVGHISFQSILQVQLQNPLLWMIDTAPIFLGLFAYFGGVQYDRLNVSQAQIHNLNKLLEDKNKDLESKVQERTEKLESSVKKLVEANQIRNEIIATVSHELRTPLTAIGGAIKLIKSKTVGDINESGMELIEVADRNANQLNRLIDDILDIEKLEAGELEFDVQNYPVKKLVDKSVAMNQPFAESFDIKLVNDIFDDDVNISIDKRRFLQVMSNLISNACKFSPANSSVIVSIRHFDKIVRISITDSGKGVPKNIAGKIFEKFFQVDSSNVRSRGGTGLGLNISKSLVECMGGIIGFYPNDGQGSVFFIEFEEA